MPDTPETAAPSSGDAHDRLAALERFARELDWNLLRTFMVIVQEGGITRAADRMLLKQPTVSNRLKRLEEQLGRKLIERGSGAFRVTAHGDLLYRECVEIHGNISRLSVLLRDIREEISGHVSIAMASHVVSPLLDDVLADFHDRHPRVTFSIDVDTSIAVAQAVQHKRASLGVCLVYDRLPGMRYESIFREHFQFFCGRRNPLFGRTDLTVADLRDQPLVSFKTDQLSGVLRPVALLRTQERIEGRVVGTSSNLEEVRRMILAGLGIGPLPMHVVEPDVAAGRLWPLPPYDTPPTVDVHMVTNPATQLNRAEAAFVEAMREKIAATPARARIYPYPLPGRPKKG
ncbi:transcriptional regulator, LysR family protein [Caenispirillum salinarum AK4]|uniref:Transcriptional regulator, LysR family protein n=1 Tax=Caenispirillum salinarum AK4 TaxID=1238182 RepID=K9GZ11_9PROT|nr:LysR family transcriptional regulator [Caenispirillum salinarum]EKV30024.1 transcriptional regulator, LysR family protein [Caenispirillum salinarum AK4]